MIEIDDGGPAFPRPIGHNGLQHHEEHEWSSEAEGMSLRDYFAGQAARQAADVVCDMLQEIDASNGAARIEALRHATAAYIVADAMLIARALRP